MKTGTKFAIAALVTTVIGAITCAVLRKRA